MILRAAMALALAGSFGCALWGAPGWVRQGHMVCNNRPCAGILSGVGHAGRRSTIRNDALRRAAAEANARAEIARAIGQVAEVRGSVSLRAVFEQTIGTEAVDHWEAGDGTEYALVTLSRESLQRALQARSDLTAEARGALEKQLAPLFEQ